MPKMKTKTYQDAFVKRVRLYEVDHAPDGWPAIQMRDLTAAANRGRGDLRNQRAPGLKDFSGFAPPEVNRTDQAPYSWLKPGPPSGPKQWRDGARIAASRQ